MCPRLATYAGSVLRTSSHSHLDADARLPASETKMQIKSAVEAAWTEADGPARHGSLGAVVAREPLFASGFQMITKFIGFIRGALTRGPSTSFHPTESSSFCEFEDTRPGPELDRYEERPVLLEEVRPFLEVAVFHSPLIRPEHRLPLFEYLAGMRSLEMDRSPARRSELLAFGVKSKAPVARGLLQMLSNEGLRHPRPASIPSALSVQALMHWQRATTARGLLTAAPTGKMRLIGCSGSGHCDWCQDALSGARHDLDELALEMARNCTCVPYCAGQIALLD